MAKILVNTSIADVPIADCGITVPASSSYNSTPGEWYTLAGSAQLEALINAGTIVINDGYNNLSKISGNRHIQEESIPRASAFLSTTTVVATANTTTTLTVNSSVRWIFTGSIAGQKLALPDARLLDISWEYKIYNKSLMPVSIIYDDLTTAYQIAASGYAKFTLQENSTNDGLWVIEASNLADIDLSNPDFTGVKDGFEDFMFDAYAGAGGNDNQYSFTPETNNGTSNIDGAVTVVGNDYEGIHILNTLNVANSRPLVHAFNGVNRIKLGAQPESYEIRVRIETLATVTEKFTARFGLMDITTAGQPANGIFFSYDPVYPVTPIKQIVTATPDVTSKAPTQVFTQTVNGVNYTHTYLTYQVITVTPNSFPVATFQRISITWTRANNTTYTVIINGTTCSYTSDATATDAEISAGLSTAINNNVGAAVTATNAKPVVVTSNVLGQAFTYSGTNVTITLVTANTPKEVYTETIGGVPYAFTSDGTPTAAEVVTGLTTLINADSGCPATATGTTTLILTDKSDPGDTFTYSGSANLTQADTTASTTALAVCNALRALMVADTAVDVSGTTTLIMTAKVAGIAFTYSGTANLVQVLTQPNVPLVLYSGNWLASVESSSSETVLNSNIPVVANRWYRLKAVCNAAGTEVFLYIDSLFIGSIVTALPTAALRYVFKLEKTVGTSPRTCSIDYITWRRTRG